jgi:hypothetical protein
MNDDLIRAEIQEKLRRHQREREVALARLAATPHPSRAGRLLTAARRVALALAVAAGLWLLVTALVGGPAVPAPTPVPPVTTAYPYLPTPAGPPTPAWPVGDCPTP